MLSFTRLALLAAAFQLASGFVGPVAPRLTRTALTRPAKTVCMAKATRAKFFSEADRCLGGECSIDDVGGLIAELRETIKTLETELREVKDLEKRLADMNAESPEREEVREIIKSVIRALTVDAADVEYPAVTSPGGYSGDPYNNKKRSYDGVPTAKPKK